jgi:hypothetical protein
MYNQLIKVLFFLPLFAYAGTVRLANDSIFKLRAVIRAADGSYLGETVVPPLSTMSWNDYWGGVGYYNQSRTPYTVIWYCSDGEGFSVCLAVPTGGTVTALSCDGTKACKSGKKSDHPPSKGLPPEEYLQEQMDDTTGAPQGPANFQEQQDAQQKTHQSGGPP